MSRDSSSSMRSSNQLRFVETRSSRIVSKIDVGLYHKVSRIETIVKKSKDFQEQPNTMTISVEGNRKSQHKVEGCDVRSVCDDVDSIDNQQVQTFSKKVDKSWYQRYAKILNPEERTDTQPYHEIAQDELETAMQQFYGKYYRHEYSDELADEYIKNEMHLRAMKQYNKSKISAVTGEESSRILTKRNAGITLGSHIKRLQQKTEEKSVDSTIRSRWNVLRTSRAAKSYFHKENILLMRQLLIKRFLKVIHVIIIINKFVSLLIEKHYSIQVTIFKLPDGYGARMKGEGGDVSTMKTVFNPSTYESNHNKQTVGIAAPLILILTKPWYTRSIHEIGDVVKCLYPRWVYHKYPLKVQLQMAHVAWYTRIGKQRPIVREGNPATRFYILLSGQVAVTELIKDKALQATDQYMKFVKYINKGERFGDEEMDFLARKRFYNAYSTTTCELLSIEYSDYQESLTEYDSLTEMSPPHILFISKMPFIKSISRVLLLRSAKANQIQVFYFCHEAVVASSLEKSDFVFVVLQGECHTALKQRMPRSKSMLHSDSRIAEQTTSHATQKSEKSVESRCKFTQERSPRLLSKKRDIISGSFMNSKLTQEFARIIRQISENCLTVSKEMLVKEIHQIRLMKLISGVYGPRCVNQIAGELADKMRIHETENQKYEEQIRKIKAKTLSIERKVARAKKKIENMPILKRVIQRTDSNDQIEDNSVQENWKTFSTRRSRASQMRKSVAAQMRKSIAAQMRKSIALANMENRPQNELMDSIQEKDTSKDEDEEDEEYKEEINNKNGPQGNKVPYGYSAESRSKVEFKLRSPLLRIPQRKIRLKLKGELGSHSSVSKIRPSASSLASNVGQNISSVRIVSSPSYSTSSSVSTTVSNAPILREPRQQDESAQLNRASSQEDIPTFGRTVNIIEPISSEQFIDRPPSPVHYSQPINVFRKGEIIGNEYINYNDGKYRRHKTDPALISDGVELIMVAKSFLIERLYDHHRKRDRVLVQPHDGQDAEES